MDFNDLFSPKNTVTQLSLKDLEQANHYIELVKAFARVTNNSIYIIDYQLKSFEFVSDNPLFLAGLSPGKVMEMGYSFYQKYVPLTDFEMLININNAGFSFYETIPLEERKLYVISYDFQIQDASKKYILINHKLTPFFLTEEGKIWKAMCIVSLSSKISSGNVTIEKLHSDLIWHLDLSTNKWVAHTRVNLTQREIEILRYYHRGLSIHETSKKIFISIDTVKFHRRKLFEKLGVSNMSEALAFALNNRLL
ncbi:LuxR C-terminal-related transcriptional regulator [Sphingobacterium sp. InxBP1]|uniref:response regulator transcription factor n=1 Tax=Sphingobacterium sp. InxBP1 TaxID=2870328 RepID=UPI0022446E7D|nr:LuxR C-terminal-related transcriptional regulator [Sphingobacterium sp. InxBP1]MCW8311215.1 LuxR C-terminal-related transcriptional regulator [Sphingobacterium sp. InxBP1]